MPRECSRSARSSHALGGELIGERRDRASTRIGAARVAPAPSTITFLANPRYAPQLAAHAAPAA